MKGIQYLANMLVVLYVFEILLVPFSPTSYADENGIIQHTPPTCVTANYPVVLSASIVSSHVEEKARVYFRMQEAPSLYFVQMQHVQEHTYSAMLPAPVDTNSVIEYFFQISNQKASPVQSETFYTFTSPVSECPAPEDAPKEQDIVVYADQAVPAETGFSGDSVQWKIAHADEDVNVLAATQKSASQNLPRRTSTEPEKKTSILGISPKTALVVGAGVGAAVAIGLALKKEEDKIEWTLDPQDLNDKIAVEIIKTPEVQTICGTTVTNQLYVTNKRQEPLTVTTIDYEIVLTKDKPGGSCDPGRIGTFAPNWAVVLDPGEHALVREWSNQVNPCSGCPYIDARCTWASKYVVHTTLGSGEAETKFAVQGDLCAGSAAKFSTACTRVNADVEP